MPGTLIKKWQKKIDESGVTDVHAPPRLIETGLDWCSIVDSDELQDMWAGLLSSSCTSEGNDDSNLIFMNILDQLTIPEVKIVNYSCSHAVVKANPPFWLLYAEHLQVSLER